MTLCRKKHCAEGKKFTRGIPLLFLMMDDWRSIRLIRCQLHIGLMRLTCYELGDDCKCS